jgi:hypothetical protein
MPLVAPTLIVEDGAVGLFGTDWERLFDVERLEDVTEEYLRAALNLPPSEMALVYLPPIRDVPNADLFSEAAYCWRQAWWQETVNELTRAGILPTVPLRKAS